MLAHMYTHTYICSHMLAHAFFAHLVIRFPPCANAHSLIIIVGDFGPDPDRCPTDVCRYVTGSVT